MNIAIDFDGTCVTHEFPAVGKFIGAERVLKLLVDHGHNLILFTMRSDITDPQSDNPEIHAQGGTYLSDAVKWFEHRGIPLWGIQTNPDQGTWTTSPKAYAHLYIDDAALGCPLAQDPSYSDRPFVDWAAVHHILIQKKILPEESYERKAITEQPAGSAVSGLHPAEAGEPGALQEQSEGT